MRSKVTEHAYTLRPITCGLVYRMSTKVPFLARLGIYRISSEKQETLLKLLALSTAAILCK